MSRSQLRGTFLIACLAASAAVTGRAAVATPTQPPTTFAPMPTSAPRPTVPMSLREAITIALEDSFQVKTQEISLINSRESFLRSRTEYLPSFNVGPSASFGGQDVNVRTQGVSLNLGVSQKLPVGATVSLSTSLINISRRSRQNPTYSSSVQLGFSGLSLLRMSPRYNLNSQRSARVSLENSFLSYKNQIQGIVQNIESLYLSLISAREQLEIQRRNLQLSETTYNETTARVNVGTQTELQRIQAEITLLNARDNFSNTERSLIAAEDALRTALGGGDYDVGIIPTDPIADFDGQLPNAEESFQLALANGTDYQIALKNLENTEAAAYVAEVNARPNISLSGNIALYGSDTDFSPAWNDIGRRDNYAWGVNLGANVSLPLRNERSNARTARNNLTSAQIQLEQLRNQIYTNVRSQIRSITQNYQSAQLAVQQVDLSQRNYDAENARYQQGLTTYRDLQTAQNNLESARTTLLNRRIALRNALNSLSRIEGRTLDRFGITVPTE